MIFINDHKNALFIVTILKMRGHIKKKRSKKNGTNLCGMNVLEEGRIEYIFIKGANDIFGCDPESSFFNAVSG